jgi:protein-disulfide isomerase
MNNKAGLNDGFISQTLADLELDERTIVAQRSSQRITDILDENRQLAQALDVAGTPAFVIGNQVYPGALEKHEFEAAIEAALAAQSGSAN